LNATAKIIVELSPTIVGNGGIMYFVVRRTWLAGADPTGSPDLVRTVAKASSREAAEARAAALACSSKRAAQLDPERGMWLCKAPDALHAFEVCEMDGSPEFDTAPKRAIGLDMMRAPRRILGATA
jgi:hypothetical protein